MSFIVIQCHSIIERCDKPSGVWGLGNTPQYIKKKGSEMEPLLLIYEFVILGAESRQTDTIAIALLGYDLENLEFRS